MKSLHAHLWLCSLTCATLLGGCTPKRAPSPASTPPAPSAGSDVPLSASRTAPATPEARLQRAEQSIREGDTYSAIPQLEIVCDAGGQNERLILKLAELYNTLGEAEEAAERLAKAAAGPNVSPELLLALSQSRARPGDFKGAADALHPLLPRAATLPVTTQQWIARTLLLAGQTTQAAPLLPPTAEDPEWLALKGLAALMREQPQRAAAVLTQAVARNPQDAWNTYLLGLAWQSAGNTPKAIEAWEQAVQLADPPHEAILGLAQLLARTGQAEQAFALLQRIQADESKNSAYWQADFLVEQARHHPVAAEMARGFALFYDGDPWKAEAVWKAILPHATGEDAREIHAALHNSAFKRQDAQEALQYATEAARRWPDDPYFHRRRAEVLLGQNRMQEAEAEALKWQKLAPREQAVEVTELFCRIALDAGKPDMLRQSAERYQQLRPDAPDPLLHLAEWQAQQGRTPENLERTLDLYRQVTAIDPKNAEAQAQTGILLADLKRTEEAVPVLLHALTLWPRVQDGTPHAQLARIYQREGRAAEARFHAERYQKLRQVKERWPTLLKAMRQNRPVSEWMELGETALLRRENWIALCAFRRATQLAPQNPTGWRSLAAVYKRMGSFEEAFRAIQRACHLEPGRAGKRPL